MASQLRPNTNYNPPLSTAPDQIRIQNEIKNTPDLSFQRAQDPNYDKTNNLSQYNLATARGDLKTLDYLAKSFPTDPRFHTHESMTLSQRQYTQIRYLLSSVFGIQ